MLYPPHALPKPFGRLTDFPRSRREITPTYLYAAALILILCLANLAADVTLARHVKDVAASRDPPLETYSFIEDDYPPHLPIPGSHPALGLTLEETAHYNSSYPQSKLEWSYAGPFGDANVRIGPTHRFFNTGFSYQQHCLRVIVTMVQRDGPPLPHGRERAHVERCLNVLRQFALCSADTTLERPDSLQRDFAVDRSGGERSCADWPTLYGAIEENWATWKQFQESMND
ncbi:hypothetical protein C2E23DRAFT_733900 [Lenzites betulinus]|nr:hypothetical protein C2E23DRAFT_733900 [Lenzites betulinus]